jgi:hypothetical protein
MTNNFIAGATMMGSLVIGLFFLKFWKRSRDRLFLLFGIAFWILAINRMALALIARDDEVRTLLYVVRLAAFVLMLVGIIDKNRSARRET